jgi:hypothetical protein
MTGPPLEDALFPGSTTQALNMSSAATHDAVQHLRRVHPQI